MKITDLKSTDAIKCDNPEEYNRIRFILMNNEVGLMPFTSIVRSEPVVIYPKTNTWGHVSIAESNNYTIIPSTEITDGVTPFFENVEADPCCLDCRKPYSTFGLDVILPHDQWMMIHPEKNGLLCAQCIVNRTEKIENIVCLMAKFEMKGDADKTVTENNLLEEAVELLADIEKIAKLSKWDESFTGRNVIYNKLTEFLTKYHEQK